MTDFVLNMGSDIETEPRTYFVRWASKIGHNDEEEEDHEHDEDDENKGDDREDREDRKEKQDREN